MNSHIILYADDTTDDDGNIYVKLDNNIVLTNAYEQQDSLKENFSYFRIT